VTVNELVAIKETPQWERVSNVKILRLSLNTVAMKRRALQYWRKCFNASTQPYTLQLWGQLVREPVAHRVRPARERPLPLDRRPDRLAAAVRRLHHQ